MPHFAVNTPTWQTQVVDWKRFVEHTVAGTATAIKACIPAPTTIRGHPPLAEAQQSTAYDPRRSHIKISVRVSS